MKFGKTLPAVERVQWTGQGVMPSDVAYTAQVTNERFVVEAPKSVLRKLLDGIKITIKDLKNPL